MRPQLLLSTAAGIALAAIVVYGQLAPEFLSKPAAGTVRILTWNDPSVPAIDVAAAWDRSPNELVWSADSKTLFATAQDLGHQSLFSIDIGTGHVNTLVGKFYVTAPAVLPTPAAKKRGRRTSICGWRRSTAARSPAA